MHNGDPGCSTGWAMLGWSIALIRSRRRGARLWRLPRRGRSIPVNDSWIAACCLAHNLPLATRNVKDYKDVVDHEGLVLI